MKLKSFRLRVLRWLIGKTSVVANVTIAGEVLVGDGLVVNSLFADELPKTGQKYNDAIVMLSGSVGIVSGCCFQKGKKSMTVYYVGPGGKDDNDGLTWENRKETLTAVEQVVQPGDEVRVMPLTKATDWKADASGKLGKPITYELQREYIVDGN